MLHVNKALFLKHSLSKQVLKQQGAVPFVKTNVPQTMISWDTSNPIFGATTNPHKPGRGVGGSSGGEAALVADGGSVIGVGGDIGGSIRIPTHMCGIFGFKPTAHRIRCEYQFIFLVTCKHVSSMLMVHVLSSILIYWSTSIFSNDELLPFPVPDSQSHV